MKKLLFIVAFVSSATVGAVACSSDLKDACEEFIEVRDACEALSPPEPEDKQKYFTDLCANIDPDCLEFFQCAIAAAAPAGSTADSQEDDEDDDFCDKDSKDRFRLDIKALNAFNMAEAAKAGVEFVECKEPENKACTDADLRP